MIKILFICHGNICRSPMAEFLFRDMVQKRGLGNSFFIASAATSREDIGNPVHRGTVRQLKEYGISTAGKYAALLRKKDYDDYNYIIGMENENIRNINRIIGEDKECKVHRLLDFSDNPRNIEDPWYTGNFDCTYVAILEGCEAFLQYILERNTV